jgi:hypothetical protein
MNRLRRDDLWAPLVWLAVFAAAWITGERVRVDNLASDWQVLPLESLRDAPVSSIWRLHTQPPAWNVLVGVGELIGSAFTFTVVMAASGAVLAWSLAGLTRLLGCGPRAAAVVACVATLNGPVLTNAFVARYEMPTAALLALTVLLAARCSRYWAWVAVATLVVLTRSMYHPLWLVVMAAAWWWTVRSDVSWRRALRLLVVPLVLCAAWMGKNMVQIDTATMSSWSGMNLLRSVQGAVGQERLDRLAANGTISPVGAVPAFSPYAAYEPLMPPCDSDGGAAIDDPVKGTMPSPFTGQLEVVPNFNHTCFVPVYEQAGADAFDLIRAEPDRWVTARLWATNNWFGVPALPSSSPVMGGLVTLSRPALLAIGHPGLPGNWEGSLWVHEFPVSLVLLCLTAVVLVAGSRAAWRCRRSSSAASTVLVLTATVAGWTATVGIVAELGEQERFRTMTDPLVIAVGAAVVLGWWRARQTRLPRPTPQQSVVLSVVVLLAAALVVWAGQDGGAGILAERPDPPTTVAFPVSTSAPPAESTTTAAEVPRPECRHVVHLGDSNLGLAAALYRDAYTTRGVDATVDHANGRGTEVARDGGTSALDAVAAFQAAVPADGRCWVIALSTADAATTFSAGEDPTPLIVALADAVGDEPVVWITPIMVSTTSEWTYEAAAAYNSALREVAAARASMVVFEWQDVALDHLDQFQPDGVHYEAELYDLQVDEVLEELDRVWDLG